MFIYASNNRHRLLPRSSGWWGSSAGLVFVLENTPPSISPAEHFTYIQRERDSMMMMRNSASEWPTHSVIKVGYVDVPAQSDKVHVNYPEFGREEVEVDHLSWRPNTPVSLQEAQFTQLKNPQMH